MVVGVSVLLRANILLLICFILLSSKEDGGQCKCNLGRLKNRTDLLRKYIEGNELELQALFAVQALFVQLDYPPGTNVQTYCSSWILFRLTIYFNFLRDVIEIIVREGAAFPYEQLLIIPLQICVPPKVKCTELYPGHIRESSLASCNLYYDVLRNRTVGRLGTRYSMDFGRSSSKVTLKLILSRPFR